MIFALLVAVVVTFLALESGGAARVFRVGRQILEG